MLCCGVAACTAEVKKHHAWIAISKGSKAQEPKPKRGFRQNANMATCWQRFLQRSRLLSSGSLSPFLLCVKGSHVQPAHCPCQAATVSTAGLT